ncbi:MAG: glycosyltransferase [Verrucomicrobia bacterium]|nr:glycosyltransferase [Verrucomicrobiota bacterium]MCH8526394.1 glycosyltransferase [Kiritimatiellia bacterium]
MTVSILMATRDAARDLPGALDAITAHAPGIPLLIWDGASTDGTVDLLRANDHRITRWQSAPDLGIYDAFHKLIDQAQTDFVYFLGADDRLRPEWTRAVEQLQDPGTLYYGDVQLLSSGQPYAGPFPGERLAQTNICQQAIFYPRSLFQRHRFHLEYRLQADWHLNMRCWADPDIAFQYLPLTVCDFNDLDGSSSTQYDTAFNRDYPRHLRACFSSRAFLRHGLPALLAHHTRALRGKA